MIDGNIFIKLLFHFRKQFVKLNKTMILRWFLEDKLEAFRPVHRLGSKILTGDDLPVETFDGLPHRPVEACDQAAHPVQHIILAAP